MLGFDILFEMDGYLGLQRRLYQMERIFVRVGEGSFRGSLCEM